MKLNKSQKKITIITDRKAQNDLFTPKAHQGFNKRSGSCQNQPHKSPSHKIPISCKNIQSVGDVNFLKDIDTSAQKHKRQRSTSLHNKQDVGVNLESRKKQLDFLCFQRIVNQFKKFLLQRQQLWDLQLLCYSQLIKILWICRFVPYAHQQQYIANNQQSELKKIYLLWLSISFKKVISYRDFISFAQIIQNINVEEQKIEASILNLQNQINGTCAKNYENFQLDPNYTFFMKKMEIQRKGKYILIDQQTKQKLFTDFKSFKFNRLKDSGIYQYVKTSEEQIVLSKKSSELADQKRKKISNKIRQNKPHVQNINLLDLLSFRERDHGQFNKKTIPVVAVPQKKKSIPIQKRGELKKEIQMLSRPKVHFQERKQDEINFEKEEEEFTFQPKINSYKLGSKQKIMQVKNADKVLVRMKQARKIKQQRENIIQKGWSSQKNQTNFMKSSLKMRWQNVNDNKQNMMSSEKQQITQNCQKYEVQKKNISKVSKYEVSKDYLKIPLLYIDVNIQQGKKQRIIIYDNDKASDLAQDFGQKHKLSEETVSRLETLLQQQMDTVLARIQEESDDECSFAY